jgi:uncharacterized protein YeeX (DUF496 family)
MYIPAKQYCDLEGISLSTLKTLQYKKISGNDIRFKKENGQLLVHENFKALYRAKVEDLFYKALIIAKNENALAKEIAKMIGKKKGTVLKYFTRFTFKHNQKAIEVVEALEKYIQTNSIFSIELLEY